MPFGPYVGGVAVAARRGVFSVAWVDTLAGTLDGSGLDAAWVVTGTGAPVRVARFKPLPERFAGDSFRNVGLLSLAGTSPDGLYLAYAADVDGQADVLVARSTATGWGAPVDVGGDLSRSDQFQPSVAVARDEVHVLFLDRRLDPSGTFADEWLASSSDGGTTWTRRRLSHRFVGPGDRRPALAHGRPPRRSPGAGRRPVRRDRTGGGPASRQRADARPRLRQGPARLDGSAAVRVASAVPRSV